jgi:hypothetical protein
MKNLFWVLCVVASVSFLSWNNPVYAGGEMKEVCHDKVDKAGKPVMDKKTGKQAQECKKIKVHKKLEGTAIPEDKKKK